MKDHCWYNAIERNRCKIHSENVCKYCRYRHDCELIKDFPQDIWKPVPSDKAYIPGRKMCGDFLWS